MLILYLLGFVAVAKYANTERINPPRIFFDERSDTKNADIDTCSWPKTPQQTLPNELSDLGDMERLVIYVYRSKVTKEIYFFIPQEESQYCFPNLANEEGGGLTMVDSDDLQEILNTNPNTITQSQVKYDFESDSEGVGVISTSTKNNDETGVNEYPEGIYDYEPPMKGFNTIEDNVSVIQYGEGNEENKDEIPDYDQQNVPKFISNLHDEGFSSEVLTKDHIFLPVQAFLGKQMTFDEWFTQQLNKFVNSDSRFDQSIEVQRLKSNLKTIFNDNNIYVRDDGVLINDLGIIINPSNLNMRPILIGDSIEYKRIQSLKDNMFSFPSNSPYLDTIVVNQISPPKLLGIIALGKTVAPKRPGGENSNNWQRRQRFSDNEILLNDAKNKIILPKQRIAVNKPNKIKPSAKGVREYRSSDGPGISSLLQSLFGQKRKERKREPFNDPVKPDYSDPEYADTSDYDLDMDDELGFKIIGGNAATSSGTPLSSRGRSSNSVG